MGNQAKLKITLII